MEASPSTSTPRKRANQSKLLNDYVCLNRHASWHFAECVCSNSGTLWERARLVKSSVSDYQCRSNILSEKLIHAGALNWATGETVAVKEIQLSNIPKGELGQIMVSPLHTASCTLINLSS